MKTRTALLLGGICLLAAALKAALLIAEVVPFNADEAIVALMARHILDGARPTFFYGQAYLGSLDAWLIAAGFAVFGVSVWVARSVQICLYLGTIITTYLLGRRIFGSEKTGVLAALFLAVPAINVTLYTTVAFGGYGEALVLGNIVLLLTIRLADQLENDDFRFGLGWLLWGFLVGFGLWMFGLTLVYTVPAGVGLLWKLVAVSRRRGSLPPRWFAGPSLILAGGLAGSAPWWTFALTNGLDVLITELGGGAIAGVGGASFLSRTGLHLFSFVIFGSTAVFGLRPPWGIQWLGVPLLPFALVFWAWVNYFMISRFFRQRPRPFGEWLLIGVFATLSAGFVFSPFGADPSGRYFLPLAVPLALFAGEWIRTLTGERRWAYGLVALVLLYNAWGTLQTARETPPGITTQFDVVAQVDHAYMPALIEFLKNQGIDQGYTNYWVAYPLAFESGEELIFVPRLPYHLDFRYTPRDNRYAPYNEMVAEADRVAYITTNHEPLNAQLRESFTAGGVEWEETIIGDYHIFHDFSRLVRPEEIGW